MSDQTVEIAELDDEEGKVYIFGVDSGQASEEEFDSFLETVESLFEEAEVLVFNTSIEGGIRVQAVDKEELREAADYYEVVRGING